MSDRGLVQTLVSVIHLPENVYLKVNFVGQIRITDDLKSYPFYAKVNLRTNMTSQKNTALLFPDLKMCQKVCELFKPKEEQYQKALCHGFMKYYTGPN